MRARGEGLQMSNIGLDHEHIPEHFNLAGLCQCPCSDCTTRTARLCVCMDCPCESDDDEEHR